MAELAHQAMFGGPIGSRIAEEDYDAMRKHELEAQEMMGKIAMQPAHQRIWEAKASTDELALANERRFQDLMQGYLGAPAAGEGGPTRQPIADRLEDIAGLAIGAGKIKTARELVAGAAQARMRNAIGQRAMTQAELNAARADRENIVLLEGVLHDSNDEASFQKNRMAYTALTGRPDPFAGVPYHPDIISSLKNTALTTKQRLDTQLKQDELDRKIESDADLARHRGVLERLRDEELKRRKQRDTYLQHNGGKSAGSPLKGDVDQALTIIKKDFPNQITDPTDLYNAAYDVAGRAKAIQNANRAKDMPTAIHEAYAEARKAGDFQVTGSTPLGRKRVKYRGAGKTPATAMALPADKNLVEGRWYLHGQNPIYWAGERGGMTQEEYDADQNDTED